MKLDLAGPRPRLDLDAFDPPLTASQRDAMAFDREVVVSAGAGAGKTHTLSLRYTALLLELAATSAEGAGPARPDVEGVLVLTFTEKAAEEMAERCYRRLSALGGAVRASRAAIGARWGARYATRLVAAVDHLIDTFPAARISTFHGFCARLLRENPIATDTPPGFRVLEDVDAWRWRAEACEDALEALVAGDEGPLGGRRDLTVALLGAFGSRRRLLEALAVAVEERATLAAALERHAEGRVTIGDLVREAPVTVAEVDRWLAETGRPLLARLAAALEGAPDDSLRPAVAEALAAIDAGGDALARFSAYRKALDVLLTGDRKKLRKLTHASAVGKKASWADKAAYWAAKEALDLLEQAEPDVAARAAVAKGLPTTADVAVLDVLRPFARAALDAIARLRARFRAEDALDFAELQARAVAAVTGAEAGGSGRGGIGDRRPRREPSRTDTGASGADDAARRPSSASRSEVEALRAGLRERFRWLMVDEFQDTDETQWALVRALGRDEGDGPATADGAQEDRIFLVGDKKQAIYGFRGGDVAVFSAAIRELGVRPVALAENFRSRPRLIAWMNALFETVLGPPSPDRPAWEAPAEPLVAGRTDDGGDVSLVLHAADDDPGDEAEAVARMVAAELLPRGYGDRARHPTPPIAVLLRTRTRLGLYERALRRHGVPFVVAKGVGFWARPEVLDLVNVADALATGDRIALAGVLRSALAALPDQIVFDALLGRWGALDSLDDDAPEPLRDVAARWAGLVALRDRIPASALLREAIDRFAASHAWAATGDAGQAEANAARLVGLAAKFDAGGRGLRDAARFFRAQVEAAARESEATVDPGEARVVLLTVHAAKGLEFPVVVVPELHAKTDTSSGPLGVGRLPSAGWRVACRVVPPDAKVRAAVRPGLLEAIEAQKRREEDAESRRLFYVACTRARDELVLVGAVGGRESGTWVDLVRAHWPGLDVPSVETTLADGTRVRPLADLLALAVPSPAPRAVPAVDVAPPPPSAPPVVEVSPSQLDTWAACPARWYLSSVLRVPEPREPGASERGSLAAVRGKVVHGLLEDDLVDDETTAFARFRAACVAEGGTVAEAEAMFPTLLAHLRTAAADPDVARVLAADGRPEVAFRLAHGHLVVRGQIDRLWLDRDAGGWVVTDWKSEAVGDAAADAARRHERQLRAYAWAASKVLVAAGQPHVVRGEVYFTSRGELVGLGPWTEADHADFERTLDEVGDTARRPWRDVEADAVNGRPDRPCPTCPYRGTACRGRTGTGTGAGTGTG